MKSLNILLLFVTVSLVAQIPNSTYQTNEPNLKTVIYERAVHRVEQTENIEFISKSENILRKNIKTNFINSENDDYDNVTVIEFTTKENENLDFTITEHGMIVDAYNPNLYVDIILDDNGNIYKYIDDENEYTIYLSNGKEFKIDVTDFKFM